MSPPTSPTTVLPQAQTPRTTRDLTRQKRRGFAFALIALVLVVVAVAGHFYSRKSDNATIGSIAVLPFVNQNNDPNMDYLSDGIPESIIDSLSQLPNLKVMSRNSAFQYKGKAQKLQLKLAGNETKGITKRYTDNNDAYQLYLKGRFHFARRTKDDLEQSIPLFQQAITLDPNFALAYVGIAESYAVMPSYPYMSPKDAMPLAKAAVAKALTLDPEIPEAHTVSGMIASTYDSNWNEAEREFKRSLELDPNLAITHYRYAWVYLSPMGRHEEAIEEMKRAMELEALVQGANFPRCISTPDSSTTRWIWPKRPIRSTLLL